MLKVWGRPNSSATQKVLLTCAEAEIPFEFIKRGGEFGGLDAPDYLAMNPTHLIPTIDDDGYIGWESNSCVRYLAAKHAAGTLWPEDLGIRGEADKWMDWQCSHWMDVVPAFAWMIRGTTRFGAEAGVEPARLLSIESYGMLEARLEGREFVAGDRLTMGDIALMPRLHQWLNLDLELPPLPSIRAWYARMMARPTCAGIFALPLT
jgi:glutathione S-transferase